jgi:type IV secretory pathway protease TraF
VSTHGEAQRQTPAGRAGRGDPATQSSQPLQPNRARTARRAAEPARHVVSLKQGLAWGLAVASVLMLTLAGAGLPPRLIWTTSASAPAGLYWIDYEGWTRGDRVAVRPGERLAADLEARGVLPRDRLLIKRIIASSGDTVCRNETVISVNGAVLARAREQDSHGRLLPKWEGCISLTAGEVFLMGDGPGSYDGRYFGVSPSVEIVGRAGLMLSF